jgi:hypothetical protein
MPSVSKTAINNLKFFLRLLISVDAQQSLTDALVDENAKQ